MKRALVIVMLAACASASPVSRVRFKNAPPVATVNDRVPLASQPKNRPFQFLLYYFDVYLFRQLMEVLDFEEPRRALNTNSFDELPDSTWFTNRIGIREITPDELKRGPYPGRQLTPPLQIKGTKVGGKNVGFIVKDANGDKFITKFDEDEFAEIETAANMIVMRFMWALGYNVPDDSVHYLRPSDFVLAGDAAIKDVFGNKKPMTQADLHDKLARIHVDENGFYRTNASKFLDGVPIGGYPQFGVREDDPNDHVPHEHRRDIRALGIFYGWLASTDVKEDNSLDIFATDPADKSKKYVIHYINDFGKSLGAYGTMLRQPQDNHAARLDLAELARSMLTFGLRKRPWEGTFEPQIRGVARIDIDHYAPETAKASYPYRPFELIDRWDGFWAAKLVMRFSREHIRAAVEAGQYSDSRATDYVTEVLIGRQQKLGAYWFSRVSPFDGFQLDGKKLCFTDLMIKYALDPIRTARTEWAANAFDHAGRALGWNDVRRPKNPAGTGCFIGFPLGATHDGYTILRLEALRHGEALPAVEVHIALDPATGLPRVIGIHRT